MSRDPRYEMDFGAEDESGKPAAVLEAERHASSVRFWGPDNEPREHADFCPIGTASSEGICTCDATPAGDDERDYSAETP